jgi:hypothetical protein
MQVDGRSPGLLHALARHRNACLHHNGDSGGLKPITMAHQKRKEIEIKEEKLPG